MVNALQQRLLKNRFGDFDRDAFDRYAGKRKLSPSCPVIHIAGSNGKSSLAHYLEAIYLAAGYHVATFLSPWVYAANDAIRYDGKDIDDATLSRLYEENQKDFDKFELSAFECLVALAYRFFEEKKPDLAIVECGMGGVVDATNLDTLNTVLSVVTNISLEHTSYLGTTLSQIALHTAGIIKPGVPLLVGRVDEESLGILFDEAKDSNAPFTRVERYYFEHLVGDVFHFDYGVYKDLQLHTIADYQLRNASLAAEAVHILQSTFPVKEEAVREGLFVDPLPLRVERMGRITLDAAQNPDGVDALVRCVNTIGKGKPVHVLFASLRDKNIAVELPALANACADITLTTFDHPLARGEEDFFLYAADHPYEGDAILAAKKILELYPEDVLLVTGSLEFAAFMKEAIVKEGLGQ